MDYCDDVLDDSDSDSASLRSVSDPYADIKKENQAIREALSKIKEQLLKIEEN